MGLTGRLLPGLYNAELPKLPQGGHEFLVMTTSWNSVRQRRPLKVKKSAG